MLVAKKKFLYTKNFCVYDIIENVENLYFLTSKKNGKEKWVKAKVILMNNCKYFLLLVGILSLITIPILLLIIPINPLIVVDFAILLLYPSTIIFIFIAYVRIGKNFNSLLLPLSFITLFIIHYVVGFIFADLYNDPHPEWHWYYVGFFIAYTVPFFIITLIISTIIEIIKYKMKQNKNDDCK